ncbi:hypothetical protein [Lacticaseibacillus parakribbianus]|uniref:hypothetical protein n=1 Tax=Lacticaseibacillus parakribbianus TaxID=2970927 RepID=UPI0021CB4A74|nr:hypothetical protein [Lacticaseibacillus parakribbianus]
MTGLIVLLIFVLTGGLTVMAMAKLHAPWRYVVAGLVAAVVLTASAKLTGRPMTIGLAVWLAALVGGLTALRVFLRRQ